MTSDDIKTTSKSRKTRRAVLRSGAAAVATLGGAPALLASASANTPPQLMRHASRAIVLQFDVAPGLAKGVPPSELTRS